MTTDPPDRLPTRPLRNWLLAWHIHTGDLAATIASGFDLEIGLVQELLGKRARLMLEVEGALRICRALRVDPAELWDARGLPAEPGCRRAPSVTTSSEAHLWRVFGAL